MSRLDWGWCTLLSGLALYHRLRAASCRWACWKCIRGEQSWTWSSNHTSIRESVEQLVPVDARLLLKICTCIPLTYRCPTALDVVDRGRFEGINLTNLSLVWSLNGPVIERLAVLEFAVFILRGCLKSHLSSARRWLRPWWNNFQTRSEIFWQGSNISKPVYEGLKMKWSSTTFLCFSYSRSPDLYCYGPCCLAISLDCNFGGPWAAKKATISSRYCSCRSRRAQFVPLIQLRSKRHMLLLQLYSRRHFLFILL